jgi:hypothetical protein
VSKKTRAPFPALEPYKYSDADIHAFRALAAGKASEGQQQRVLACIVQISRYYDLSFQPGPDGERATAFAEGMRFVGAQVVKLTKLTPQS